MLSEPEWLTFEDIVELNWLAVQDTHEPHGLIDAGVVEGALNRCRNHYLYGQPGDVIDLACMLMMSFARSQGFQQGNKRTGFLAAQMFLNANGFVLDMPDHVWIADMVIAAIKDLGFQEAVRAAFRGHVRRI